MKKLLIVALTLISTIAHAQAPEEFYLGVKSTKLLRNQGQTVGLQMKFISKNNGFSLPISVEFGKDLYQYAVGIGLSSDEIKDVLRLSTGAALAGVHYGESFNLNKDHQNKLTMLLREEISFQISKRLNLGVELSLDLLNWIRVYKATRNNYIGEPGIYQHEDGKYYAGNVNEVAPRFSSKQEYNEYVNSAKKSSMTNVGLTLRYNLFKR